MSSLTATRLVEVDSLPEDILTGIPVVVWEEGCVMAGGTEFQTVCRAMRSANVALVCVAGRDYDGFVVVIAGKGGLGLLKGLGHADSLLPVPITLSSGASEEADNVEGGVDLLEKAGLGLLAVGRYEAWRLGLGGKVSGGSLRRVNFSMDRPMEC